jgi:hypothetical protein
MRSIRIDSDGPTAVDAKRQWKERIAELREGDKGERRLADLLAGCAKGNRCCKNAPSASDAKRSRD